MGKGNCKTEASFHLGLKTEGLSEHLEYCNFLAPAMAFTTAMAFQSVFFSCLLICVQGGGVHGSCPLVSRQTGLCAVLSLKEVCGLTVVCSKLLAAMWLCTSVVV